MRTVLCFEGEEHELFPIIAPELAASDVERLVSADATHLLECRHCYNSRSSRDYTMRCVPMKTMEDGRLKVLVFGRLYWGGEEKKIRYVAAHKVSPIEH